MGLDSRISDRLLAAGPGFGRSCFPKDTRALLHATRLKGAPSRLLAAAVVVNRTRVKRMSDKVESVIREPHAGRRTAGLGLTFKANTDDLR